MELYVSQLQQPILFKTRNNPRLEEINITKCLRFPTSMTDDPSFLQLYPEQPSLRIRRAKNIGDIVSRSAYSRPIDQASLDTIVDPFHISLKPFFKTTKELLASNELLPNDCIFQDP